MKALIKIRGGEDIMNYTITNQFNALQDRGGRVLCQHFRATQGHSFITMMVHVHYRTVPKKTYRKTETDKERETERKRERERERERE